MNLKELLVNFGYWTAWNLAGKLPERFIRHLFALIALWLWKTNSKGVLQLKLNLGRALGREPTGDYIHELSKTNIQNYFSKLGIDSSRVIFATKLPEFDQHISRMSLANLFLDTHPYNAHTTTLDAIRAKLPVLTKIGNTFSSRVAASILNQID